MRYGMQSLYGEKQRSLLFDYQQVVSLGETGKQMCEGEFESLKAIHAISPLFAPKPYAWGTYEEEGPEMHFLLEEFRDIAEQPAGPVQLATALADMHHRSKSPTGKFGFHVPTSHARIVQVVDIWEESWSAFCTRYFGHVFELAKPVFKSPDFDILCDLILEKVLPTLLLPLQSEGRSIKPCLLHGDCWDGNTAVDAKTGEAFVFDASSFYGHNEFDISKWRAPRHRLSNPAYIEEYLKLFPPSEPVEQFEARSLLYSLIYNMGHALYLPKSQEGRVVCENMMTLCEKFCGEDLDIVKEAIEAGETEDADC